MITQAPSTTSQSPTPRRWRRGYGLFFGLLLAGTMLWTNCGDPQTSKEQAGDASSQADQSSTKDQTPSPDQPAPQDQTGSDQPAPVEVGPTDQGEPDKSKTSGVTYHGDIRGIIDQKCLGCHNQGGIGPFKLTNYAEVKGVSAAIKSAVSSGRMPPWLADKSCGEYKHSLALSADQIKMFTSWIDNGTPEGDPAQYVPPKENGNIGIPRVDVSLKMPTAYTPKPKGGTDDYRCFVIDWPKTENTFVTGFQVKAGNKAIVHHVIAYLGEPDSKASFQKLDDADDGPGYTCYGGPKGKANWLAAWAPGKPGSEYPKGTGLQVKPGSVVILQVHYNTLQTQAGPDQTSIEFMTEPKVTKQGYIVPIASTNWMIPKGDKNYKHVNLIKNPLPIAVEVHSVSFHMHLLGVSGRLFVERDGKEDCMLNIPRWDFNWQFFYDRVKPMVIKPTDKIGIECRWNNSKENQAIVDGKRLEPRDVTWGDGTTDEMCLGVVYVTPAL